MSLILDALKKSEAERLRGQTPHVLSHLPTIRTPIQYHYYSKLPWLFVGLLLIVICALTYIYTKSPDVVVTPITTPTSSMVSSPKTKPPISAVVQPALANSTSDSTGKTMAAANPLPQPSSGTAQIPVEAILTLSTQPEPVERIASLSEMSSDLRQQLPALKLSMHVYSSEAGKRFAIIDGQRFNEGSLIGSAVVVHIRQDGVVLSIQGQYYLLPRP